MRYQFSINNHNKYIFFPSWDSIGYGLDGLGFESCEDEWSASCSNHFTPNQITDLHSERTVVLGNGVIKGLDGYLAAGGHVGSTSTVGYKML